MKNNNIVTWVKSVTARMWSGFQSKQELAGEPEADGIAPDDTSEAEFRRRIAQDYIEGLKWQRELRERNAKRTL